MRQVGNGRVEFRAEGERNGSAAHCFSSVEVFKVTGGPEGNRESEPLWGVSSRGQCTDRVIYPDVPAGFVISKSNSLQPGTTYDVIALIDDGVHSVVSKRFTLDR